MPSIRVATRDDLSLLRPLIERAYRGDAARAGWTHEADLVAGDRTDGTALTTIVDDPDQRLLLAERDGAVIGCVNIADRGNGVAYLGLLCVEPAIQAQGIGRRLMDAAERVARELFAARRIEMTVIDRRSELIAYYQRRGYAVSGETRPFPIALEPPLQMTVLVKPL